MRRMVTLENSTLLARLPADALAPLRAAARERCFGVGQEIFKEGEPGDGVYVVQEGSVEISVLLGPGRRQTFSRIGPGDLFGEMAVLEDQPRSAGAVAVQETAVWFIPRAAILEAIRCSPELALALLREISHRLREFNRQYLADIVQAERLAIVGRFARSIIHDLKNPLNLISLTAEMAGADTAPPALRRQAPARIRQQVERISDLVNEILDFTQGTRAAFVLAPMDYAEFFGQAAAELRAELALKGAKLELENRPPTFPLLANPKRLRRLLHNLAHNATDAMPAGGRLLVRFEARPGEVVTEIEDTGPGIPPQMANRLFEAFATHGKAHGTGLGLSICKKIIEDHGGRIWSRTEPGRGAIFAFTLPRAK
jgi:signal transduction histidine kinase